MPGGAIQILVEPDVKGFPAKLESGLRSSTGIATKIGAGLATGIGVGLLGAGAAFTKIISLTSDYQSQLNSLQAVTGATGEQMAQVGAKAIELGNDISLPGTSAATAAEAMLELAKGGLTVQQSMDAAKGTLTLAAAAQVDGARAAQIQSDALNQFGLKATDASHVADLLANSANASAVEITDVAESMKFVGPVAHAMGISIEDTTTAIGLLGNAGIRGSEAGTALRGMLASLSAPSTQSAKALTALGVSAYDSQGKFRGFPAIIDQLRTAQGKQTDAQFQNNVATAFGRETMSGVLALVNGAPDAWDKMEAAVTRSGGAQEVAAAKMKGLGGAIEGFKGQLETTAITIGQALSPALEGLVRGATGVVGFLTDAATGAGNLSDRFPALNSVVETGKGLWQDFTTILGNAKAAVQPVIDGVEKLATSTGKGGGSVELLSRGVGLLGSAAAGASVVLKPIGEILGGILSVAAELPGPLQAAALAYLAFKAVPGIISSLRGETEGAAASTGRLSKATSALTAPVTGAVGGLRQFRDEMRLQQSLAAASGESLTKLGAAQAAFETSTVGSVAAVRSFRDDMRTLQSAADGAGAPISRLDGLIGALAQRSPTVAAMATSFTVTSRAVTVFGDQTASAARRAAEALGPNLAAGVRTGVSAIQAFPAAVSSAASTLRTGLGVAAIDTAAKLRSLPTAIADTASTLRTGLGVAALDAVDKIKQIPSAASSAGSTLKTALGVAALDAGEKFKSLGAAVVTGVKGIPAALETGISAVGRFTSVVAGAGASIGTGLLKGAGSLISFLGGPWGIALAAASVGLELLGQHQQEAAQKAQEHQQKVDALAGSFDKLTGAATQASRELAAQELTSVKLADGSTTLNAALVSLGISTRDYVDATTGNVAKQQQIAGVLNAHTKAVIENSATYQRGQSTVAAWGVSLDDLTAAANGNEQALAKVNAAVDAAAKGNPQAARSYQNLKTELLGLGGQAAEVSKQFGAAIGTYNESKAAADAARAATQEFGDALKGLTDLRVFDAIAAGNPTTREMAAGLTQAGEAAKQLALSTGQTVTATSGLEQGAAAARGKMQELREQFIAAATASGIGAVEAGKLADQYGLIPADVETTLRLNAGNAVGELQQIADQLKATPDAKTVTVKALGQDAIAQLDAIGIKVTTLPDGQVQVDLHDEAARAKFDALMTTLTTAKAAPTMDLNTATAQQKADAMKAYIDGLVGIAKADADAAPGTQKADQLKAHIDGITAIMKADADTSPGTAAGDALQKHIDGLVGIMTADANNKPGTAKGDALRSYINGLIGIMEATANTQPGTDKSNALKAYIDRLRGLMTADASTAKAEDDLNYTARARTVVLTTVVRSTTGSTAPGAGAHAAGAIVSAMDDGGVLGMARGGFAGVKLTPMSGRIAQIVPPRTMRIIGDRITDDEAFIPINKSARSRRILEEAARRMGYAAVRMYADGGLAAQTTAAVTATRVVNGSPAAAYGPVVQQLAAIRKDLAQVKSVVYAPTINNPVAEPAAATKASDLRTAAALKVLT